MSVVEQQTASRTLDPELRELLNETAREENSALFRVEPCELGSAIVDPIPSKGAWRERWTPTEQHLVVHFREELATLMRAGSEELITSSSPRDFHHPSHGSVPSAGEIARQAQQLQEVSQGALKASTEAAWFPGGVDDPVYKLSQELALGLEAMRPSAALRLIHGARRLMDTDALRVCHSKALMDVGEFYEGNRLARTCTTPRTAPRVRASAWSFIAQSQVDLGGLALAAESYLRAAQLDPESTLCSLGALLCSLTVEDLATAVFAAEILDSHGSWEDRSLFAYAAHYGDSARIGHAPLSPGFSSSLSKIEDQLGPLAWHLTHETLRTN
ncbi:MAG TPA: hypothetical protein EYQ74_12810 [Planctomycetes bacterium]|nr:hypothetical protein [Planctomycetota bacterium]HIK62052.1 hypothetical protein [Planctomycetota bacterium]